MPLSTHQQGPFSNPLIRFISEPRLRWLRHSLFIAGGFILAFKGDLGSPVANRPPGLQAAIVMVDALTFLFVMAMNYLLLLLIIPRLLFKSRIFLFALSLCLVIAGTFFYVWWLDVRFLMPADAVARSILHIDLSVRSFVEISAVSCVVYGSVAGLSIFKKWIDDVRRMDEVQQARLKTELEQLKSQVNPHFLFNTLNNLYVLTRTDAEKAGQVILGLSDLLRYQLYEGGAERILISRDIDFIHNLLELEKIRKNDFDYQISTHGRTDGIKLPPFLFIPFVENAVKHGVGSSGHAFLKLQFSVEGEKLIFVSENSKPSVKPGSPGGLGLANIRRRLELLYPNRHQLIISDMPDTYLVKLILPL